MGIIKNLISRNQRVKNYREIRGMSQNIDRKQSRENRQIKQQQRRESFKSSSMGRLQQRFQRYAPRQTPSSQQAYFKARAKILRGAQATFPQSRIPGVKSQFRSQGGSGGRVKYGRGRPKGTYTYSIPGQGKVDVFTWRRYINSQKQAYKIQLQQQYALQRIAQKYGQQVQPQLPQDLQQQVPQQQIPYQQYQKPQFAGQSVMPVEPQPYKEISILERTPLNMSGNTLQPIKETYEETDLMTGRTRLRLRTGGFL